MTTSRINQPGKAEPRFDIDVVRGRQGELQIGQLLDWIAKGDGAVEVKTKSYFDFDVYVETSCDKGRKGDYQPSGISVTTAHVWAFCIEDTGISVMVPTDLLREMLDDPTTQPKEQTRGSCPTRGKLIKLGMLLFRLKQRSTNPTPPKPANTFGHDLTLDKVTVGPAAVQPAPPKPIAIDLRTQRESDARNLPDESLVSQLQFVRDNSDANATDRQQWIEILEHELRRRKNAVGVR